jgi:DNA repair protein RecO
MMDVINRQSAEGEENRPLFSLAKGCLRLLEGGLSPQVVSCFFEIKFVKVMGYMPSLHRCAACEGPGDHLYMSYRRGGGICPKCLGTSGRDQGMEVSPGTLQILRFMARTAARHLPTLNIHPSVLSQAREYLKCHMEHNLPGRPAAIKEYEKLSG